MKKALHVLKFGGTSVGTIERIGAVAHRIKQLKRTGVDLVVVVSAMSGETNRLMELALQVEKVPAARELDVLLSAGELVSMSLLSMALNKLGVAATSLTGGQAQIVTDQCHNNAAIQHIDTAPIQRLLSADQVVVVAGFQGITTQQEITTLGRGGSDTSAVMLAGALKADECQIYTDVDGIYSCDPRVVANAVKLTHIDFPSMEMMARQGAKVLHLPSVQYARQHHIPLRVLSSFSEHFAHPAPTVAGEYDNTANSQGSLVAGNSSLDGICGLAIQRDLVFIQVDSYALDSLITQCKYLGITVWSEINRENKTGVVIEQCWNEKLRLVFVDKIRNSEPVSALSMIGSKATTKTELACQILAEQDIILFDRAVIDRCCMLLLRPDQLDEAANIIHDSFVISREVLEQPQQFEVF